MRVTAEQALGLAWILNEYGSDVFIESPPNGPWLTVEFFNKGKQFAIWNTTGAVHAVGEESYPGAVSDDPIYTPAEFSAHVQRDQLLRMLERVTDERDDLAKKLEAVADYLPPGAAPCSAQ